MTQPSYGVMNAFATSVATASGPLYEDAAPGTEDWVNTAGAKVIRDGQYANVVLDAAGEHTYWLRCTGFNFNKGFIGSNFTIDSVTVTVWGRCFVAGGNADGPLTPVPVVVDAGVKLILANVIQGNDHLKQESEPWPVGLFGSLDYDFVGRAYIGSQFSPPDHKWGLALTPSDVFDAQFGCAVGVHLKTIDLTVHSSCIVAIDAVQMSIVYSFPPPSTKTVQLFASTLVSMGAVHLFAATNRVPNRDILLKASVGFGVTITTPAAGCPTVTTAAMTVAWELTSTQVGYRVQVFADAGATEQIYDSGFVGSGTASHVIPAGYLPSPATGLYVRVYATNKDGVTAVTSLVCFDTNFATSVNVANVVARAVGGCEDPTVLPGARISWSQVTPGGSETFVTYAVRRRRKGDTVWKEIATLGSVSTLAYYDYNVEAAETYEYSVVWRATSGVSILQSADTTQGASTRVKVDFDFAFLHPASIQSDDDAFTWIRVDGWNVTKTSEQQIAYAQPWGRALPTAFIGQALGTRLDVPMHPDLLTNKVRWQRLVALQELQRDQGAVLCLRFGRAKELYYVTLANVSESIAQKTRQPKLSFVETYWEGA